jgi:hypothetical protein
MFWRSTLRIDSSVSLLFLGSSFALPETTTAKCSQKPTQNFNFRFQNYRRFQQIFVSEKWWKEEWRLSRMWISSNSCDFKSINIWCGFVHKLRKAVRWNSQEN